MAETSASEAKVRQQAADEEARRKTLEGRRDEEPVIGDVTSHSPALPPKNRRTGSSARGGSYRFPPPPPLMPRPIRSRHPFPSRLLEEIHSTTLPAATAAILEQCRPSPLLLSPRRRWPSPPPPSRLCPRNRVGGKAMLQEARWPCPRRSRLALGRRLVPCRLILAAQISRQVSST